MAGPRDELRSAAETLLATDVVRVVLWRDVVIAAWFEPPSVADLRAMRDRMRPHVARLPSFAGVNVVSVRVGASFGDDARRETAEIQREFEPKQSALATVVEGTGFFAATVRGVAAGIAIVSRVRFPSRVFASVPEASRWIASVHAPAAAEGAGALAAAVVAATRRPAGGAG